MLSNYTDIENLLSDYGIDDYILHKDLSVSVSESVDLRSSTIGYRLKNIPIQFKEVSGFFDISENDITSLKGCPEKVGYNFRCTNNKIYTLDYAPKNIGGELRAYNNLLRNLRNKIEFVAEDCCFDFIEDFKMYEIGNNKIFLSINDVNDYYKRLDFFNTINKNIGESYLVEKRTKL